MMKILNIGSTSWSTRKGGASAVVREMNKFFRSDPEVEYVNFEIAENLVSDQHNRYYSNTSSSIFKKNIHLYKELKKQINQCNGKDMTIISHYIPVLLLSILLIKSNRNIRHIHYFHGPGFLEYKAEKKSLTRVLIAYFLENIFYLLQGEVVFLSNAFKDLYFKNYWNKRIKFKVIPYGVEFSSDVKIKGRIDDVFRIICIRRLQKRMGIDILLKAIKFLDSYNIVLHIVGSGPELKNLMKICEISGIQSKVVFHGNLCDDDLEKLFENMDVSILPTLSLEGFGISIIDSLINGVPVLATSIGGIPEILNQFNSDYLIYNPDPQSIAKKIKSFINKEIRIMNRSECITFIKNNYSYSKTYYNIL